MLWKRAATLEQLNQQSQGCMVGHLGIEFTRLSDDELEATMPVDSRTTQPFGLLHGGASVVLAESLGSMAGYLCTVEGNKWWGWRSMPTTSNQYAQATSEAAAVLFMWGVVIRSGRLRFLMSRDICVVLPA